MSNHSSPKSLPQEIAELTYREPDFLFKRAMTALSALSLQHEILQQNGNSRLDELTKKGCFCVGCQSERNSIIAGLTQIQHDRNHIDAAADAVCSIAPYAAIPEEISRPVIEEWLEKAKEITAPEGSKNVADLILQDLSNAAKANRNRGIGMN